MLVCAGKALGGKGPVGGVQQLDLNPYLSQLVGSFKCPQGTLRARASQCCGCHTLGTARAPTLVTRPPSLARSFERALMNSGQQLYHSAWWVWEVMLLRQWHVIPHTCATCFRQGYSTTHDACTPSLCCLPAHAELLPQAVSLFWVHGLTVLKLVLGSCGLPDFRALGFVLTTCMLELASIFLTSIASRYSVTMSERGRALLNDYRSGQGVLNAWTVAEMTVFMTQTATL